MERRNPRREKSKLVAGFIRRNSVLVNFPKRQLDFDCGEWKRVGEFVENGPLPAIRSASIDGHFYTLGFDNDVVLDTFAREVRVFLFRLIDARRAWGENFKNYDGIYERTRRWIERPAGHGRVGVIKALVSMTGEIDGGVRTVRATIFAPQQGFQRAADVERNRRMPNGSSRHRVNHSVEVLVLHVGELLVVKVFHDGNKLARVR